MIEMSTEVKDLFAALAKVQKTITDAKMDSVNPHFRSKYASLASVYEACRKLCAENNISISQLATTVDGNPAVWTMLGHASGQWIRSLLIVPADKQTPQGMGSALTYGRRYALSAIVGIAADEDDDGNASEAQSQQQPKPQQQRPAPQSAAPQSPYTGDASNFVFPAGKFKGRRMASISSGELIQWIEYFEGSGQEPKGWLVDALKLAKQYVGKVIEAEGLEAGNPIQSQLDDIPF